MPKMLSPYIIKDKKMEVLLNDKVIQWVFDNRFDSNTSRKNIEDDYQKFLKNYNI